MRRGGVAHTFDAKFSDQISRLAIYTCKMADLREPFELCRVLQSGSLIGISRHAGGDNVLITFRDRGVLAYNVSNNNAYVQICQKKVETFKIVHNDILYQTM